MSRVGKKPIQLPPGVTVTVAGPLVTVQGPKGTLECLLPRLVSATVVDGVVTVAVKDPAQPKQRAMWGAYRSVIANMVRGVTEGFSKQLEISGIGFKAVVAGQLLTLNVGYSHPVTYPIPNGVLVTIDKTTLTVSGIDKQKVGQVAAEVRAIKPPEPYGGKGIRYAREVVRRKAGKQATKTAA